MKWVRYLIAVIAVWLMLFFSSCSPGKRMQRICIKHPELCKSDTITKLAEVQVFTDTIYQDSIITLVLNECEEYLKAKNDSLINKTKNVKTKINNIRKLINPVLPTYRCLTDTLIQEFKHGVVRVWQEGDKIKCSLLNIQPPVVVVPENSGVTGWIEKKLGISLYLLIFVCGLISGFLIFRRK